jgi:UDP-glucuronate decarboxylase
MKNKILLDDLEQIHDVIGKSKSFTGSIIVLTGCAGFLGYYFLQYFLRYAKKLGIKRVIGLDTFLLHKPEWLTELASEFPDTLDLYTFDISKDDIGKITGIEETNFVIHAASIASPSFYRQFPVETIDGNIWGLRKIFDFFVDKGSLRGLLFFSSSEIYGDPDPQFIPTEEEYRGNVSCHGPRACYDESKRFGETICWIYASKFNLPITVARPFNNYGPGMRIEDKRLPADFAKCILENRDIVILSDGTPSRTFCYISDAITGYLLCLLHGKYDYFNIGTEKPELMVKDFAKIFQRKGSELFGYTGSVIYESSPDLDYMTDNPNRRCPVIKKARTLLGYDPKVSVEEGIGRYLEYLKIQSNYK